MNLFNEIYDGELDFEIRNKAVDSDLITLDLYAEYDGEEVGLRVVFPIKANRFLFNSMKLPDISKPIVFKSLGECSDRLVTALDRIWSPDFEVVGKFEENDVEIEFAVLNREAFDVTKDKVYTRVYAQIDMETGDDYDNINMEIGFNFNLERNRASLVETKKIMRNDFLALIMQ